MLKVVSGGKNRFCDGTSRRSFLQIGALGFAGLTFSDLLRAESNAGIRNSNKAVINIHLSGGPSHQDMFDLKPNAPKEFRGDFNPINTNVSGIQICEHMPRLAAMADKYAIVRSLVGMYNQHSNFHTHTGFDQKDLKNVGGRPALGSVIAKMHGPGPGGAPAFISYNGGEPGFLGPVYRPYKPSGNELRLSGNMTVERLENRTTLLSDMDNIRRNMDAYGQMDAMDSFTQAAVGVVTSGRVADALDTNLENPEVLERYGDRNNRNFLLARRLVEAGVRTVTFNWGSWDTHSGNFTKLRDQLPKLDQGMSALLTDLHERGLQDDVSVVLWGEFGRSPRVNNNAGGGRDHWSKVAMCVLAGGGMRTGQVIGSSTKNAEEAQDRPVHLREIMATLYHNMGVNAKATTIADNNGRPQYLVDGYDPISELI